jgi:hypothetical protein
MISILPLGVHILERRCGQERRTSLGRRGWTSLEQRKSFVGSACPSLPANPLLPRWGPPPPVRGRREPQGGRGGGGH